MAHVVKTGAHNFDPLDDQSQIDTAAIEIIGRLNALIDPTVFAAPARPRPASDLGGDAVASAVRHAAAEPSVPASVALTLAGHSHCGQVNLPVVGRLVHASRGSKRWPCGSYDEAGRKLYVTGGVGVSILPVRFRARPEIAVVTLRAAKLELASTNSAH